MAKEIYASNHALVHRALKKFHAEKNNNAMHAIK